MRCPDRCDFFLPSQWQPQVYWFNYPTLGILRGVNATPAQYLLNNAVSYARLCLDVWRDAVGKPLVLTGQAYWGESSADYSQATAESKLTSFLTNFDGWGDLQGLNWWHIGGRGQKAMSFAMYKAIKEARLNGKFGR